MADERPTKPVTITRADLYNEVWTTPMQQLAARYGISGNGLAKICDRLKVPCPGRLARPIAAAGQKVGQTRLPDKPADVPDAVTIRPTPPAPAPPTLSPELAASLAAAREQVGGLAVPKRLARPTPSSPAGRRNGRSDVGRPDSIPGTTAAGWRMSRRWPVSWRLPWRFRNYSCPSPKSASRQLAAPWHSRSGGPTSTQPTQKRSVSMSSTCPASYGC